MNDSKNSSNGLLVLRSEMNLSQAQIEDLTKQIEPLADKLGLEPVVLPRGFDVDVKLGSSALLERVCAALEEIAAQGRAPEVSEAEIAPQALNARKPEIVSRFGTPSGLNTRDMLCKGSWALGTACGKCSSCKADQPRG